MKKSILTVAMLIAAMGVNAQSLKLTDANNIEVASQFTNFDNLESVTLHDGTVLKIGDSLRVGIPFNNARQYTQIAFGRYDIAKALILGPPLMMDQYIANDYVVIDRMWVAHTKMTKKSPVMIHLYVSTPDASGHLGGDNRTVFDLQEALARNEVINPNRAMTRDEAIAALKQQKDLLDLGMITQEQFDAKKTELASIITGN